MVNEIIAGLICTRHHSIEHQFWSSSTPSL